MYDSFPVGLIGCEVNGSIGYNSENTSTIAPALRMNSDFADSSSVKRQINSCSSHLNSATTPSC